MWENKHWISSIQNWNLFDRRMEMVIYIFKFNKLLDKQYSSIITNTIRQSLVQYSQSKSVHEILESKKIIDQKK